MNSEALRYNYKAGKNLEFDMSDKIRGRMEVLEEILKLPEALKKYYDDLAPKEQK